jgi:hypothetical protein
MSILFGENTSESDGTGGDRGEIVFEEARYENAAYGKN